MSLFPVIKVFYSLSDRLDQCNAVDNTSSVSVEIKTVIVCYLLFAAVMHVPPQAILESALDTTVHQYTFCMCNPPFFKNCKERLGGVVSASRGGHRPHARTISGASAGESVTEGGEVEFVSRIIRDSSSLGTKVRSVCMCVCIYVGVVIQVIY